VTGGREAKDGGDGRELLSSAPRRRRACEDAALERLDDTPAVDVVLVDDAACAPPPVPRWRNPDGGDVEDAGDTPADAESSSWAGAALGSHAAIAAMTSAGGARSTRI